MGHRVGGMLWTVCEAGVLRGVRDDRGGVWWA